MTQPVLRTRAAFAASLGSALVCLSVSAPILATPVLAATDTDGATALPTILVTGSGSGTGQSRPATATATPFDASSPPVLESGALLRSVPGVTAARAGGHGFEPVIRGQQQNQLNVIVDDTVVYGACPGRMDPPTSLAIPGSYDTMIVTRGYQTVTNGPGASGGTIRLETAAPDMTKPFTGTLFGGLESNGFGSLSGLRGTLVADDFFIRGNAIYSRSNTYEDGSGKTVRSAFDQTGAGLSLGYSHQGMLWETGLTYDRVDDALFNGMMDSPETTTIGANSRLHLPVDHDVLKAIDASLYANKVDHLMDNYSLREVGMMSMKTEAESRTAGGRLAANLDLGGWKTAVGVDMQSNSRASERYTGMMAATGLQSYSWPEVRITNIGVFGETRIPLAERTTLVAGGRLDIVRITAGAADRIASASGISANTQYQRVYGTAFENKTEVNLGGLLRLEQDLGGGFGAYGGLSRAVRTADASERAMAAGYGSMGWVGNPDVRPEKHHQMDVGGTYRTDGADLFLSGYVDMVEDYIVADRARGQSGVLISDGTKVTTNTDAMIAGIEAGGALRPMPSWLVEGSLAWTWGQDLDNNRPLAQIPPLTLRGAVTYEGKGWTLGGVVNGALAQNRVDMDTTTGTGRDVRATPGYVTFDLKATVTAFDPFDIGIGVTNLLDATYANHLNKATSFDPTEVQVNEPGRSFFLTVSTRF